MLTKQEKKVAVLVPCLNEELTVGCVLKKLKLYLPNAELFVVDNGSTITPSILPEKVALLSYISHSAVKVMH